MLGFLRRAFLDHSLIDGNVVDADPNALGVTIAYTKKNGGTQNMIYLERGDLSAAAFSCAACSVGKPIQLEIDSRQAVRRITIDSRLIVAK